MFRTATYCSTYATVKVQGNKFSKDVSYTFETPKLKYQAFCDSYNREMQGSTNSTPIYIVKYK